MPQALERRAPVGNGLDSAVELLQNGGRSLAIPNVIVNQQNALHVPTSSYAAGRVPLTAMRRGTSGNSARQLLSTTSLLRPGQKTPWRVVYSATSWGGSAIHRNHPTGRGGQDNG